MNWKLATKYENRLHLKRKGDDKTLCGKPQENYDTETGEYSLEYVKQHYRLETCRSCLKIAESLEPTATRKIY